MIQANELRIGNLVYKVGDTSGDIYVADHITILMAHNYIPIPLRPEWLERAGFVNRYSKDSWNICYEFILSDRSGILQVKSGFLDENKVEDFHIAQNDSFIANAKYVHQLQNLVFALTGKEIEFK